MTVRENPEVFMNRKSLYDDILAVGAGCALFGIGLSLFLTPCGVILGGASGIAVLIHRYIPLPVGMGIILVNLPLLLFSVRITGWRGMTRTVLGVLAASVSTDIWALLPAAVDDPLLGAVFGGAIMGAGGALMLPRGVTTGGTDLAAYLICKKWKRCKVGTAILLIDTVIVSGAAVLSGNFSGIIHSAAAITAYSVALDTVMGSMGRAKLSLIISEKHVEIGDAITRDICRGVTVLNGRGWFTGADRSVILCVVKRSELFALKSLVRAVDPAAFLIISDAAQVLGQGFEME